MEEAVQNAPTGAENVTWDLTRLYSGVDDPAIEHDMQRAEDMAKTFAATYKGRLADLSTGDLHQAMQEREAFMDLTVRIASYAYLMFAIDTNDPATGALVQKVNEFEARVEQTDVFFLIEWNNVPDEQAQRVLDDPAIGDYRHYLEAARRYKPHQLPEEQERLLIDADLTGLTAWRRFFAQLIGSLRFDMDGEQLPLSEVLSKSFDPDRNVRRRAHDSVTEVLRQRKMETSYIFNVVAADKQRSDRLRGYESWISERNLDNKVSDNVVDALIDTVTSNYELVARHYRLKRALLGLDELIEYDRYAPLPVKETNRLYTWDDAQSIVLNAFNDFSSDMHDIAREFFDSNYIHAALMPNKRGGAFAMPVTPSAHPYVMLNYTGKANDVMTLAHELGHGIHMKLSGDAHGLFGLETPLTTAETASVFAEMLVFQDLLRRENDREMQLSMLLSKVEDTIGTVFRQTAMNRFENSLHTARREEGELSPDRLNELWLQSQRDMYGDSLTIRDEYGPWWEYIPHFIDVPGYVYAYAFGELLVLALYRIYEEEGQGFEPKYIQALQAGDSDYPDRIMADLGVDLNDPNFWQKGIDAFRELVEREEALAHELYPDRF